MAWRPIRDSAVRICAGFPPSTLSTDRSIHILRLLFAAALRKPRLALAIVLLVLAVLASTLTYTGYLLVGVLADYLGTSRFVAGLLLGIVFARFPRIRQGKLRIVGLLPAPARKPLIVGLLALGLVHFLWQGDYAAAGFMGFATAFVLGLPWLRRTVFERVRSSLFGFVGRRPAAPANDDRVIEGEFRERKD